MPLYNKNKPMLEKWKQAPTTIEFACGCKAMKGVHEYIVWKFCETHKPFKGITP